MANTFTPPVWVKSKPHASAEKQVGDSDPSARTDVINRTVKGVYAILQRLINTLMDGVTLDFTDLTTVTALAAPVAVRAWAYVTVAGGVPSVTDHHNVASITDVGVGTYTLTWDKDFANATYAAAVMPILAGGGIRMGMGDTPAAGTYKYMILRTDTGAGMDTTHTVMAIGDW